MSSDIYEVQSWRHADRRPFPAGPWDDEPDKMQWVDRATGLDCLIVRNNYGALCGYVGVPNGHPQYRQDGDGLDVHGGITFGGLCDETAPEGHGICHIPRAGRPGDVYWFGFDCAHAGDLVPGLHPYAGDQYRTIEYVTEQCAYLASQLAPVSSSEGESPDREPRSIAPDAWTRTSVYLGEQRDV